MADRYRGDNTPGLTSWTIVVPVVKAKISRHVFSGDPPTKTRLRRARIGLTSWTVVVPIKKGRRSFESGVR